MAARQPLSGMVADQIRDQISNGQLLPGQKLNEREIMDRLGITRTPLREAMSILLGEKLIETSPSRGAIVTVLSDADIRAMLEVRGIFERRAGELAAARASDDEIAALAATCARMEELRRQGDATGWWEMNRLFHSDIVALSGNPVLVDYYANTSLRMTVYNYFNRLGVTSSERWAASAAEHEQILDRLGRRDGPGLGALLEEHLMSSWLVARQIVQTHGREAELFSSRFRELKTAQGAGES
ncbi:GntR family transcriptional regulator [Hoeflea ulvae]|uniref:GntR family transcriptional regulator n=1 Tax=Hoeflea ulvae TaxID=2983764 RepID=A0ABT3YC32_9HYPH|nr:GntR family transcriptional regulator [Hoeflea ulvae]MCY0093446.1 GntR family transcriptional regulator [Hoeflea ulvae]